MGKSLNRALYGLLGILALGVGALCVEIGKGTVPIPAEYSWLAPVVLPMLVGVAAMLKALGEGE